MTERIINVVLHVFKSYFDLPLGKEVIVFLISSSPILELRGGLILASILKMNALESYILCVLGNILPVPFILALLNKVFDYLKSKGKFVKKIKKYEDKALKQKEKIDKYRYLALTIFVAVPLPGSGAWTGALIASLLFMDKKKSFVAIILGIFIASIIMMLFSYGLIGKLV